MTRSTIAGNRPGRDLRLLACAFIAALGSVATPVRAADAQAQMKYAPSVHFANADDQRFVLLASESVLGDDCDPLPLASSSGRADVVVLAKAEAQQKKSSRASRAKPETTLLDAAPMAVAGPAAIGVAADGSRDWDIVVTDKTLNATLARWAASAGWQLLWELPVDYAVQARTSVHGTFEEAVGVVARSMESAEIPMKAVFYQGNKVLRIMAKGSE